MAAFVLIILFSGNTSLAVPGFSTNASCVHAGMELERSDTENKRVVWWRCIEVKP